MLLSRNVLKDISPVAVHRESLFIIKLGTKIIDEKGMQVRDSL